MWNAANGRSQRKAHQLCREVEELLTMMLAGAADDLTRDLAVQSVEPMPDSSRLLISVYYAGTDEVADARAILSRLEDLRPALKQEIAVATARRRVPELTFRLV